MQVLSWGGWCAFDETFGSGRFNIPAVWVLSFEVWGFRTKCFWLGLRFLSYCIDEFFRKLIGNDFLRLNLGLIILGVHILKLFFLDEFVQDFFLLNLKLDWNMPDFLLFINNVFIELALGMMLLFLLWALGFVVIVLFVTAEVGKVRVPFGALVWVEHWLRVKWSTGWLILFECKSLFISYCWWIKWS